MDTDVVEKGMRKLEGGKKGRGGEIRAYGE